MLPFIRFPSTAKLPVLLGVVVLLPGLAIPALAGEAPARKIKDLVVYEEPRYYAAFPSVVRRPDGELLVAFRRAPSRVALGETKQTHTDPNSYLVAVRSRDGGESWSKTPELIYAHALGGSQDPCLLQLRDGTLLCATYGWAFLKPEAVATLKKPVFEILPGVLFLGGYHVRSSDGGKSWQGPIYPRHIEPEIYLDPYGQPLPAYNRGAMFEANDGRILWVVAANDTLLPARRTSNHLMTSGDKGLTWTYSAPVALDAKVSFSEASAYQTPKGDIVAFLRTADYEDQACIARSTDGGATFQWQGMGFKGHPLHALRLADQRVFLVYGYRHKPYGIRARVLNAECTDFATAPEIILREDGGTTDIGYPWSVALDAKRVLVVYYFNLANGPRHIAGTVLEL